MHNIVHIIIFIVYSIAINWTLKICPNVQT